MESHNVISNWLENEREISFRVHSVERDRHMKDYAAKLNRLVEAAREARAHLAAMQHKPLCAINIGDECDCTLTKTRTELAAALRDIELPKGRKTSNANPSPS